MIDEPRLEGWLIKEKNKVKTSLHFPSNKTKRWFVVDNINKGTNDLDEHVLCYYKNKNSKIPRGWIFLSDIKQIEESRTSRLITITHPSRVFRLEAPDENKHKAWLNGLSSLCMNAKVIQNAETEPMDLIPDKNVNSAILKSSELNQKADFMAEANNEVLVQLKFLRSICNDDSGRSVDTCTSVDQSKIECKKPERAEESCDNDKLNDIQMDSGTDGFFEYNDESNLMDNMLTQSDKCSDCNAPSSESKEFLTKCDRTKRNRNILIKSGPLKKERKSDHRLTPRLVKGDHRQTTNARLIKAIQSGQIPIESIEKLDQHCGDIHEKRQQSAQIAHNINIQSKEDECCDDNENLFDKEEKVKFQKLRYQIRSMGLRSFIPSSSSSSASTNSSSSIENPSNANVKKPKSYNQGDKLILNQLDYPSMEPLLSSNNNDSSFEESVSSFHFTDISQDRQMCYDSQNLDIDSPISGRDVENIFKENKKYSYLDSKISIPNQNMLEPDKNFVSEDWDVDSDNEHNNNENERMAINIENKSFRCQQNNNIPPDYDFVNEDWDAE